MKEPTGPGKQSTDSTRSDSIPQSAPRSGYPNQENNDEHNLGIDVPGQFGAFTGIDDARLQPFRLALQPLFLVTSTDR